MGHSFALTKTATMARYGIKFVHDVVDVAFDCNKTDEEYIGNRLITGTISNEVHN